MRWPCVTHGFYNVSCKCACGDLDRSGWHHNGGAGGDVSAAFTGDDVGDQVTGAATNAEPVPAKAGGQDETGYGADFDDARHTVGRAVNLAGTYGVDAGIVQVR